MIVADEDLDLLALIERILTADFSVTTVSDGKQAVDAVAPLPPDVLLLDVDMPIMDGIDVCRQVRAANPSLPIIILTGHTEDETVRRAFEAGATDYLAKPFSASQLRSRLRAHVLRRAER